MQSTYGQLLLLVSVRVLLTKYGKLIALDEQSHVRLIWQVRETLN